MDTNKINISINVEDEALDRAIQKANQLVETLEKASALIDSLNEKNGN